MTLPKPILDGVIKKSPIGGHGVFVTRDFKRGEVFCRMLGEKVTIPKLEQTFLKGEKRISCDAYQYGVHNYINLAKPYIYINHSCDPNVAVRGIDTVIVLRDIHKGGEVLYDYSAVEWTPCEYTQYDSALWPLRCNCGYKQCRKIITCFPYLPKIIRGKYLRRGIIQNYILKKLLGPAKERRCLTCEKVIQKNIYTSFSVLEKRLARKILLGK